LKTFKSRFLIKAQPADVYAALTKPEILEIWTGLPAQMSETPNSEFSWFDGSICGINRSFEPGRKIIQDWYFGDDHLSKVVINVFTDKRGTNLEITQENIPDDDFENIAEGWKEEIADGLRELLEE
jgi:uncharacterized protein YndB with AHSA1/START domain